MRRATHKRLLALATVKCAPLIVAPCWSCAAPQPTHSLKLDRLKNFRNLQRRATRYNFGTNARSRFGVVILSARFFEKHWPQQELNGLATREVGGEKVTLPVWHGVGFAMGGMVTVTSSFWKLA